jgi:GNAT superfamily N-acetyltransferase
MSDIYRRVIVSEEIAALCEFDKRAFETHPADVFAEDEWGKYESYWMIVDGNIVGCVAFEKNGDELWIPEFQGGGLGKKFKQWQLDFAKSHGFAKLGTVMRQSNTRIIGLNERFGFKVRRVCPNRYSDPAEDGIEMELLLPDPTCPECGKPLRTRRAKQCRFCAADWH